MTRRSVAGSTVWRCGRGRGGSRGGNNILGCAPGDRIAFVAGRNGEIVMKMNKKGFRRLEGMIKSTLDHVPAKSEIEQAMSTYFRAKQRRVNSRWRGRTGKGH